MYERLLDKTTEPTLDEMTEYCGATAGYFTRLNAWLTETFGTETKVQFPYGKGYGWGVAHHRKKKLVCNLFPEAGAFTVMLRLTNAQFDSLYGSLLPYTQHYIDNKYPCGSGGWIHYRVLEEAHLEDIMALLARKCA